jgi:glutamine amidotransferase
MPVSPIFVVNLGWGNASALIALLNELNVPVTSDWKLLRSHSISGLMIPGVGAFDEAARELEEHAEDIRNAAHHGLPILGICLGMQLLCQAGSEGADSPAPSTPGLGLLPGCVEELPRAPGFPIPHIGWNLITIAQRTSLLEGVGDQFWQYFSNSFYVDTTVSSVVGLTRHSITFPSVLASGRVYGVQFHPEKSGRIGEKLIQNFLDFCFAG